MASGVMPLFGIQALILTSCTSWLAVALLWLMVLRCSDSKVSGSGLLAVPKNKLEVSPPSMEVIGSPLSYSILEVSLLPFGRRGDRERWWMSDVGYGKPEA
jgi:hypothetical protein